MTKRARAGAAAVVTVLCTAAAVAAAGPARAGESFRTVRAARFAEVLRGVSFTPAR